MKLFFTLIICFVGCYASAQTIVSPNKNLSLSFALTADGEPTYQLKFGQKSIVNPSKLGLELRDLPSFVKGFSITKVDTTSFDETWEPVWGEVSKIRNQYRELAITLAQT